MKVVIFIEYYLLISTNICMRLKDALPHSITSDTGNYQIPTGWFASAFPPAENVSAIENPADVTSPG